MWFSRVWLISLVLLTSALVSGALNRSVSGDGLESSAREAELLIERHTLQLAVESSDLAAQPEVILALSSQYAEPDGQKHRLDQLFEDWLVDHPIAKDALLLNSGLSKDCPPGGGNCSYQPLRAWNQYVTVEEVISTLNLRSLKTKETFVPRWGWVGDKARLIVALPVTKQSTLGVLIVIGEPLEKIVNRVSSEVRKRSSYFQGELTVYLGQKRMIGSSAKVPKNTVADQEVTLFVDHTSPSLMKRASLLLSKAFADSKGLSSMVVLSLLFLLSLLFNMSKPKRVEQQNIESDDVPEQSNQNQDEDIAVQSISMSEVLESNSSIEDITDADLLENFEQIVEEEDTDQLSKIAIGEDEWNNPNSLLPEPIGAENFDHLVDIPAEEEFAISRDEEFSLDEFLELNDQEVNDRSEMQYQEVASDLQAEDEDLITPIPNQPVTSLDSENAFFDHESRDSVEEIAALEENEPESIQNEFEQFTEDLVEDQAMIQETDLVAELGQMFEEELGELFDQLESPEDAAQQDGWEGIPQDLEPELDELADHEFVTPINNGESESNEAQEAEEQIASDGFANDYVDFETDLADELSVIEDIDLHSIVDKHAEPEFVLDTNLFFNHLGLESPTINPKPEEVLHSIAPSHMEDDLDLDASLDDLGSEPEQNFDFSELPEPNELELSEEPLQPEIDDLDELIFGQIGVDQDGTEQVKPEAVDESLEQTNDLSEELFDFLDHGQENQESEVVLEVEAASDSESEVVSEAEIGSESEAALELEPEAVSEAEFVSESAEALSKAEAEATSDSEAEAVSEAEAASDSEAEAVSEAEAALESEEALSEAEAEAASESEAEVLSEAEAAESEVEAIPEALSEPSEQSEVYEEADHVAEPEAIDDLQVIAEQEAVEEPASVTGDIEQEATKELVSEEQIDASLELDRLLEQEATNQSAEAGNHISDAIDEDLQGLAGYLDERGIPSLPPSSAKPTTMIPAVAAPIYNESIEPKSQGSDELAPSQEEFDALQSFFQAEYGDQWEVSEEKPENNLSVQDNYQESKTRDPESESMLPPVNDLMNIFGVDQPEELTQSQSEQQVPQADELPQELTEVAFFKEQAEVIASERTELDHSNAGEDLISDPILETNDLAITVPPPVESVEEEQVTEPPNIDQLEQFANYDEFKLTSNEQQEEVAKQSLLSEETAVTEPPAETQTFHSKEKNTFTQEQEEELKEAIATQAPQPAMEIDWSERAKARRQARLDHYKEVFQEFCTLKKELESQAKLPNFSDFVKQLNSARQKYIEKKNCPDVRFKIYTNKKGRAAIKARAHVPEV